MTRAFDLISSEYGWPDTQILDLTLGRIRQITAAITERNLIKERKDRALVAWQTRLICGFVAACSGVDNPELIRQAEAITLDPLPGERDSTSRIDDNNSQRPIKYATSHALAQFARGLGGDTMRAW